MNQNSKMLLKVKCTHFLKMMNCHRKCDKNSQQEQPREENLMQNRTAIEKPTFQPNAGRESHLR